MIKRIFFYSVFCALGMWGCLLLQEHLRFEPILASAMIGLIASVIPKNIFTGSEKAQACLYSGSFSGIGIKAALVSPLLIFILPLIQGVIFYCLDKRFIGFGGKLGTISFLSVGILYFVKFIGSSL